MHHGFAFAFARGKLDHNRIALNLIAAFDRAYPLPCRAYGSDVKLRVARDTIYYPDAMVICHETGSDDEVVERPLFLRRFYHRARAVTIPWRSARRIVRSRRSRRTSSFTSTHVASNSIIAIVAELGRRPSTTRARYLSGMSRSPSFMRGRLCGRTTGPPETLRPASPRLRAARGRAPGNANSAAMIDVRSVVAVAGGAALGGVARFVLTALVAARVGADYAYLATFGINVTGSFLIGVAMEVARARDDGDALWRIFVVVGILGGYTTFSSFSYEASRLASNALTAVAIAYVLASVVLGLCATYAGIAAARLIVAR